MSILLGIAFLLAGLALAVFLGIVLYREPKRVLQPHGIILKGEKDLETA